MDIYIVWRKGGGNGESEIGGSSELGMACRGEVVFGWSGLKSGRCMYRRDLHAVSVRF